MRERVKLWYARRKRRRLVTTFTRLSDWLSNQHETEVYTFFNGNVMTYCAGCSKCDWYSSKTNSKEQVDAERFAHERANGYDRREVNVKQFARKRRVYK